MLRMKLLLAIISIVTVQVLSFGGHASFGYNFNVNLIKIIPEGVLVLLHSLTERKLQISNADAMTVEPYISGFGKFCENSTCIN